MWLVGLEDYYHHNATSTQLQRNPFLMSTPHLLFLCPSHHPLLLVLLLSERASEREKETPSITPAFPFPTVIPPRPLDLRRPLPFIFSFHHNRRLFSALHLTGFWVSFFFPRGVRLIFARVLLGRHSLGCGNLSCCFRGKCLGGAWSTKETGKARCAGN